MLEEKINEGYNNMSIGPMIACLFFLMFASIFVNGWFLANLVENIFNLFIHPFYYHLLWLTNTILSFWSIKHVFDLFALKKENVRLLSGNDREEQNVIILKITCLFLPVLFMLAEMINKPVLDFIFAGEAPVESAYIITALFNIIILTFTSASVIYSLLWNISDYKNAKTQKKTYKYVGDQIEMKKKVKLDFDSDIFYFYDVDNPVDDELRNLAKTLELIKKIELQLSHADIETINEKVKDIRAVADEYEKIKTKIKYEIRKDIISAINEVNQSLEEHLIKEDLKHVQKINRKLQRMKAK